MPFPSGLGISWEIHVLSAQSSVKTLPKLIKTKQCVITKKTRFFKRNLNHIKKKILHQSNRHILSIWRFIFAKDNSKRIIKINMKRNIFLGATTLFLFLNCGEDRDDENTQQNTISQKIIGTWTIVKKESNGINVPASTPCLNLGNFIFDSNQNLLENHSSVVNNSCVTDTDSYKFTIDENSKKVTTKNPQNDVLVYAVSSLSDKELVLGNTEVSDTTKYTFSKK